MSSDPAPAPPGSQVRLRYTSFINYALSITSAVFSVFFLTVVTRRLTVEEYAVWVMIWRYVGYFLLTTVIFSTWVTRDISRGKNTSMTAVLTSIFLGATSIPFYLLVAFLLSSSLQQPLIPLLVSSVALFLDFLGSGLNSVAAGHAPQIGGYSGFTYKIVSLLFGIIFVVAMGYGLTGAIVASLLGRVAMNAISIYMNRSILARSRFQLDQVRAWARASWLPLFGSIAGLLITFDVLVVGFVYPSQVPIAYYGICVSIASFATYAGAVTSSLYPKILVDRNIEDLKQAIWLMSLLSLPVIYLMMIYAEPLCAILNLNYVGVALPSRIMIFGTYFSLLSGMASTVYFGLDPFDEKKLELKTLTKSSIYRGYWVSFLLGSVYLVIVFVLSSIPIDYLPLVTFWVLSLVTLYVISLAIFVALIKKHFSMSFPIWMVAKDLIVFAVPALVSIIPVIMFPVDVSESFYLTLSSLIPRAVLSIIIYFSILFAIEKRFRKTVRDVIDKTLTMV